MPNDAGAMVAEEWVGLSSRYSGIELHMFVVMPNHLHGLVVLPPGRKAGPRAPTLGAIVGAFKSITTNAYGRRVRDAGWPPFSGRLWQRGFYEHVVRNEHQLNEIRQYILDNERKWSTDRENAGA